MISVSIGFINQRRISFITAIVALAILITLPQWSNGPAPAYRLATQLVRLGQFDARVYDNQWFSAQVQFQISGAVTDIFVPSPPSLILLILPIALIPES